MKIENVILYSFLFLFVQYTITVALALGSKPVFLGVRKPFMVGAATLGFIAVTHRIVLYWVLVEMIGYSETKALGVIGNEKYILTTVLAAIAVQTFVIIVMVLIFRRGRKENINELAE